jgi:hypothetical protein
MADLLGDRQEPKTGQTYDQLKAQLPNRQTIARIEFEF